MDRAIKILERIAGYLINGMDGSSTKIVQPEESLEGDELKNCYAIYAPFGDVELTTLIVDGNELSAVTLVSGNQIFGTIKLVSVTAGSNPVVLYSRL